MGTKCAPAYANLFMGNFEEKYILPLIKDKTMLYTRYRDDIFFIYIIFFYAFLSRDDDNPHRVN